MGLLGFVFLTNTWYLFYEITRLNKRESLRSLTKKCLKANNWHYCHQILKRWKSALLCLSLKYYSTRKRYIMHLRSLQTYLNISKIVKTIVTHTTKIMEYKDTELKYVFLSCSSNPIPSAPSFWTFWIETKKFLLFTFSWLWIKRYKLKFFKHLTNTTWRLSSVNDSA